MYPTVALMNTEGRKGCVWNS